MLINPAAGNTDLAALQAATAATWGAAGLFYTIYQCRPEDNLALIVRKAIDEGYTRIAAAGGDGTLTAVVNGLVNTGIPLGIIPAGTVNLVAHELGIPSTWEAACRLLLEGGHICDVDAMRVGDKVFISHISVGFYAQVLEATSPAQKKRWGHLAYLWQGIRLLLERTENSWGTRQTRQPKQQHTTRFTLTVDRDRQIVDASFILVANMGSLGRPQWRWGPNIHPDDQQLAVCIVQAQSAGDYGALLWRLLRNQHRQAPQIRYLPAQHAVTIQNEEGLPVRGDGEIIGHDRVALQVLPRAVQVVVPR